MKEHEPAGGLPANGPQKRDPPPAEVTAMEKLWADAAQAFKDICDESLLEKSTAVRSFDDVQAVIEKSTEAAMLRDASGGAKDAKRKDKWTRAKSLGLTSLKYLTMLVGAASQASSFVPIPSSAASIGASALCFVFNIPASIQNYNEAIDEVFGEVASALAQFQIYTTMDLKESVDPALIKQIHAVMASFVRLCAHVVKYRQGGRWSRALRQLKKSLLDDDSGLSDEMATFHRVLQQQRDVEGTLTLAVVVETRHDVAVVLQHLAVVQAALQKAADQNNETHQAATETQRTVQALRDDADRLQTLIKIRDALDVWGTVRLDSNTTQTCTNIYGRCLEGTGAWIWDHPSYAAWMAVSPRKGGDDGGDVSITTASATHVLVISGPPSSGKTSASALITKRLEEDQKVRSYVAHYFFPSNAKKSDEDKNPVQAALKYMAFQIARVDATVRKTLGKACDAGPAAFRRASSLDNLEALWAELKIGTPGSGGATYTLVFDGLENVDDKQRRMLIDFALSLRAGPAASATANTASQTAATTGRLRILVSGTDDKFDGDALATTLRIRMDENNAPDMRKRIEDELTKQGMLQNCRPGSIQQQARAEIMAKLPHKAHGSYLQLQFELDEVIRLLSMRKKLDELVSLLDTTTSSHEAAIQTLQRSLAPHEIGELNELLKWVLFAVNSSMTLAQLEAVMFLYSGAESLVSLQYIIKNKYAAVLKLDDSFVTVQDGVKEYLQKEEIKLARQTAHGEDRPLISMTISIKNVDQETCEDFLWDLSHKAIRDKFKFDFGAAARNSRATISANELDAHHSIVQGTFSFLSDPPRKQTGNLGMYVVSWLPYHLGKLRELEEADDRGGLQPSDRVKIGSQLYELFRDDEILRRHQVVFAKTYWTVDEIEEVQKWLTDTPAMRKVDPAWRDSVRVALSPTRGFLRVLARMVVHGLVRSRNWNVFNAMLWIDRFMEADEKSQEKRSSDGNPNNFPPELTQLDGSPSDDGSITDDKWKAISKWCQSFLNLPDSDLDSLWYERIAESIQSRGSNHSVVLGLYQRAIALPNPSWKCYDGMARAYSDQEIRPNALANIELALEKSALPNASPQPQPNEVVELHLSAGNYATQVGDIKRAAEHFQIACASNDSDQALRGQLGLLRARLDLLGRKGAHDMLSESLAVADEEKTLAATLKLAARENDHADLVGKLFVAAAGDADLMQRIVRALDAATRPLNKAARTAGNNDPGEGTDEEASDGNGGGYYQDSSSTVDLDKRFIEDEARGVLLYDLGVAAYRYGVAPASHGGDPISAALRLWAESRTLLLDVGGSNAYEVRQAAVRMPAQHYFHRLVLDGDDGGTGSNRQDYVDALVKLAEANREDPDSYAAGLLGVLYALRGQMALCHMTLMPQFLPALQMLFDDTLTNDRTGFSVLNEALVHSRDLPNAAAAWSLVSQEDIVSSALHFNEDEIGAATEEYEEEVRRVKGEDGGDSTDGDCSVDKQKALSLAVQLGRDIVGYVKGHIPDSSDQVKRIQLAKERIDALMVQEFGKETQGVKRENGEAETGNQAHEETKQEAVVAYPGLEFDHAKKSAVELEDKAKIVSYRLVRQRLAETYGEHTPEVDLQALPTTWTCDGRNPDGTACTNVSYFTRGFYHCLYCWNIDFCHDCLDRLRSLSPGWESSPSPLPAATPLPESTPYGEQMVCSPRHQWLQCPVMGRDTSVGLRATAVRVPAVRQKADDPAIWEMRFDLDGTGKGDGPAPWVTIDDWKAGLVKGWGIAPEELIM